MTDKPWKINMIAVAGMNSPRLVIEDGEERIAPELVEGVNRKIVESWRNIKQVALTYEDPFALTRDGKFFCK